jgi:hypothetical protein
VAYQQTQRLFCITGICLSIPLIAFGLCTRNPKLGKEQSLANAEKFDRTDSSSDDKIVVPAAAKDEGTL